MPAYVPPTAAIAVPTDLFNDGAVPHGCFAADICVSSTVPATLATTTVNNTAAVFENFTPNRDAVEVLRSDAVGGPNGFALAGPKQITASGTVQIATISAKAPEPGMFFYAFTKAGATAPELWIITGVSDPRSTTDYWKANIKCNLAKNAIAAGGS